MADLNRTGSREERMPKVEYTTVAQPATLHTLPSLKPTTISGTHWGQCFTFG